VGTGVDTAASARSSRTGFAYDVTAHTDPERNNLGRSAGFCPRPGRAAAQGSASLAIAKVGVGPHRWILGARSPRWDMAAALVIVEEGGGGGLVIYGAGVPNP